MRGDLSLTIVLALVLTASQLLAAKHTISPGPGTPFQDAIDAAAVGDTIEVQPGTYPEALVVTKALKIRATGEVHVDAGCLSPTALEIAADGVRIKGARHFPFFFQRGQTTGILVVGRSKITLDSIGAGSPFDFASTNCATSVGIDVAGGSRITLRNLRVGLAFDLTQVGIRVHDVALGSKIKLILPQVEQGNPALDLHNVAPGAMRGESGVSVVGAIVRSSAGPAPSMTLGSADGVFVKSSSLFLSPGGTTALALDASSDANVVKQNSIEGDALDAGVGNCWVDNVEFGSGVIPTTCP